MSITKLWPQQKGLNSESLISYDLVASPGFSQAILEQE